MLLLERILRRLVPKKVIMLKYWVVENLITFSLNVNDVVHLSSAHLTCQQKHGGEGIWGHLLNPAQKTLIRS